MKQGSRQGNDTESQEDNARGVSKKTKSLD